LKDTCDDLPQKRAKRAKKALFRVIIKPAVLVLYIQRQGETARIDAGQLYVVPFLSNRDLAVPALPLNPPPALRNDL
jgi:hypothetical protein